MGFLRVLQLDAQQIKEYLEAESCSQLVDIDVSKLIPVVILVFLYFLFQIINILLQFYISFEKLVLISFLKIICVHMKLPMAKNTRISNLYYFSQSCSKLDLKIFFFCIQSLCLLVL